MENTPKYTSAHQALAGTGWAAKRSGDDPTAALTPRLADADPAEVEATLHRAVDLGITLRPAQGLSFTAVGNINEAEFRSVFPQIVAINPLAAPGQRIPGVPKSSLQLTAGYKWDFANWTDANGFITGGYTFSNSQLDSTGLVSDKLNEFNIRTGIGKDNWKFQIFGENLTNKRVAITRGSLGIQPNAPRKIGARFSVDF